MAPSLLEIRQEGFMKIDPNLIIGALTGTATPAKGASTGGATAFEDILNGMQGTSAAKTASVSPLYQVDAVSPQKMQCLSLSETAMSSLEDYSKSLVDPAKSLKDIASQVEGLGQLRSEMLNASSFLSDSDPLKGIMNDVASTLNAEVLRFKRGDLAG
jgi:hypothetical protein